jgi:hypothetical protein
MTSTKSYNKYFHAIFHTILHTTNGISTHFDTYVVESERAVYLNLPGLPKSLKLSLYYLLIVGWIIKRIIRNYQRYYQQSYR